eukprot:1156138-Pelagomonas_calceolata.AAC.7
MCASADPTRNDDLPPRPTTSRGRPSSAKAQSSFQAEMASSATAPGRMPAPSTVEGAQVRKWKRVGIAYKQLHCSRTHACTEYCRERKRCTKETEGGAYKQCHYAGAGETQART